MDLQAHHTYEFILLQPVFTRSFFIFQNLTKEQADYCISRMKPYQDRSGRALPDAYDYADFTGSMFVN